MLHGKTVIITGAGGGIGKCLVEEFTGAGADVVGWDINETALASVKSAVKKRGGNFEGQVVDVSKRESMREARDAVVKKNGRIDIWINNAGLAALGEFLHPKESEVEKMIEVNFNAVIWGTRLALEQMKHQGGGHLVNIASVAGLLASPGLAVYAATKHGVVGLTRSIRQELKMKDSPIKTLLVCPGFVDTPILQKGTRVGFPSQLSWILGKPEEIGRSVLIGVQKGKEEIFPTWNGRVLIGLDRFLPKAVQFHSTKFLNRRR